MASTRSWSALVLLYLVTWSVAVPLAIDHSYFQSLKNVSRVKERAAPYNLRILATGDSITAATHAGVTDHNSYRLVLKNLLQASGHTVNFIGTQRDGDNNPDNRHEGYGGIRINGLMDELKKNLILLERPNLVLLHIGTNDNGFDDVEHQQGWSDAPNRLKTMIDFILCQAPNTVLLVAKLIENKFRPDQTYYYNSWVASIVRDKYLQGYKVAMVDQTAVKGNLLQDDLHPSPDGYAAMAGHWKGLIDYLPGDWITEPVAPVNTRSIDICAKGKTIWTPAVGGGAVAAGAHVPNDPPEPASGDGSGAVDKYIPGWKDQGLILIGIGRNGSGVHYADLDGDGKADYLWVDANSGGLRAYLNKGGNTYAPVFQGNEIAWGLGRGTRVRFANLDGRGGVEYVLLGDDNTMRVLRNDGPSGDVWLWSELSNVNGNWAPQGLTSTSVIFGDITGDGKADMAIAKGDGTIDFYINQGEIGTNSFSWLHCPNKGLWINNPGIRLEDINNDKRADFLSVDADGGIKGWLNDYKGGCDIRWIPIANQAEKGVALGAGKQGQVRIADVDGDGKADYLVIGDELADVKLWTNIGEMVKEYTKLGGYGAGVRLIDLNGDGKDDYISVAANSQAVGYLNKGEQNGGWNWEPQQEGNGLIAIGVGAKRHQVIFADIDGDGRDDYLKIDDETGSVTMWKNTGKLGGGWGWLSKGVILLGLGRDGGVGVRFADINGDGRADYIYLDSAGAATIWLNTGTGDEVLSFEPMNGGAVAALGVGARREDVRFADIDGDGKADYLWVHPENGRVDAWYNICQGFTPGWYQQGEIAAGVGTPGRNIAFARLGPSGRADFVSIKESDGSFQAWINGCTEVIGSRNAIGGGDGSSGNTACQPAPGNGFDEFSNKGLQKPGTPINIPAAGSASGQRDICDYTAYTSSDWTRYNMDQWLIDVFSQYYNRGPKTFESNVQKSLLRYFGDIGQRLIEDGYCRPFDEPDCDFTLPEREVCLANREMFLVFHSIQNLNAFFTNINQKIDELGLNVTNELPGILTTFGEQSLEVSSKPKDTATFVSGSLAAVVGIIGAFNPAVAAVGGGVSLISSILGFVIDQEEKIDLVLKTWSEASDSLAGTITQAREAIKTFARLLFLEHPGNDKSNFYALAEDGIGFAQVLKGGYFMSPVSLDPSATGLRIALMSPVIDLLWRQYEPLVVYAPIDKIGLGNCEDELTGLDPNLKTCSADKKGIYVVFNKPGYFNWRAGGRQYKLSGSGEMKKRGFSIKTVAYSSARWNVTGGTKNLRNKPAFLRTVADRNNRPEDHEWATFSLPICDTSRYEVSTSGEAPPSEPHQKFGYLWPQCLGEENVGYSQPKFCNWPSCPTQPPGVQCNLC